MQIETTTGISISEAYPTVLETPIQPTIPPLIPLSSNPYVWFFFFNFLFGSLEKWKNLFAEKNSLSRSHSTSFLYANVCFPYLFIFFGLVRWRSFTNCAKPRIRRIWWLGFIRRSTSSFIERWRLCLSLEPPMAFSYWFGFVSPKTSLFQSVFLFFKLTTDSSFYDRNAL